MSKKKVLSKFMILCWAIFTDILGYGLDTPDYKRRTTKFKIYTMRTSITRICALRIKISITNILKDTEGIIMKQELVVIKKNHVKY